MDLPRIEHGAGFVEVGDRCWLARYPFCDVNVGLVAGERGLVLVDTRSSDAEARAMLDDVRRLGLAGEVVAVVNTHHHFDHTYGNAETMTAAPEAELVCHEEAALALADEAPRIRAAAEDEAASDPDGVHAAIAATTPLVPPVTFSSVHPIDLGDRLLELVHPGRGHTGGDLVVRVVDADVMYAGDLIEESAAPSYGEDSYPLEWSATLDLVVGMLTPGSVVLPGHGNPVGRDFVMQQRGDLGEVAETIRELAGRGVTAADAVEAGRWPWPDAGMVEAVRRGYSHLPRGARSLPLA